MDQAKLEIAKLIVQAFTPLAVAFIGWKVSKRLKDIEQGQWANRKLTEKRIQIYDEISPLLNRLLCYFTYVGDWQKHTPKDIIDTKRTLDHKVFINRFLMEPEFFDKYQAYVHALFELFNGPGEDARLRTLVTSGDGDRSQLSSHTWDEAWRKCFSDKNIASKRTVRELYEAVMVAQQNGIKISK